MSRGYISRDIQVARDFGRKAELGWMEVEFTVYGCAYLDPIENKVLYRVSSHAEDIYQFIEEAPQRGIYPGNLVRHTEKCPVPSGVKNLITQIVKINLAKELRSMYPITFFELLHQLAAQYTDNNADAMLWKMAEELEGVFDENRLNHFELLVHYARSCCRLDENHYLRLKEWIAEEWRNMEDNYINKELLEKTMYGIGYLENGELKHAANALQTQIYEKMYALEQNGIPATPIITHICRHTREERPPQIMQKFRHQLKQICDETYLDLILKLRQRNCTLSPIIIQQALHDAEKQFGIHAAATMLRYAHRWNLFQNSEIEV